MPPKDMDMVLQYLPLRIGAYVPDDLLEDWFAPRTGMNPPTEAALAAAAAAIRYFIPLVSLGWAARFAGVFSANTPPNHSGYCRDRSK